LGTTTLKGVPHKSAVIAAADVLAAIGDWVTGPDNDEAPILQGLLLIHKAPERRYLALHRKPHRDRAVGHRANELLAIDET
jgi:hypothetical protein